jgi:MFS family permease
VTNGGGTLTDIWEPSERSVPLALFSGANFFGPAIAPIIGGFICQNTTWRWVFRLVTIVSGIDLLLVILFMPETYPPKLLADKLKRKGIIVPKKSISRELQIGLLRPWKMLIREPILCTVSLYVAFVYGILFLDFTAYPIVFGQVRGWSIGVSGLAFLGIAAGIAISTAMSPYFNTIYKRYVEKLGGPLPEARLPPLIVAAWFIPLSLFWFAWTASPSHHWIVPIIAGAPFGFGFVTLFLVFTAYTVDCYGKYAASALGVQAVIRSTFGAVFPLFSDQLYAAMGTPWATTLLGFLALAMAPLPWLFYRYGPALRSRSRYHVAVVKGLDI